MASSNKPDQYGQVHPDETPQLIKAKLMDLAVELEKMPEDKKVAFEQAKVKCPDQLTDDFNLMFLRSEVFNVDLAAKRLIKYWEKRLEIFGPDRAFLPLTQAQALKDDSVALGMDFSRLVVGSEDSIGRGVIFIDPSKVDHSKYTRESMVRSVWYMIHAALEKESTQRFGIVAISFPKNAKFSQFDRHLDAMITDSLKGYLPLRLSAIHICHPPAFLLIIFPIIKIFLGERLRKRVRVHGGSVEHVLDRLATFGLTKDKLPSDIGGDIVLDKKAWLESRMAKGK